MRIYIAGKYSDKDRRKIDAYVNKADAAAREVARMGHVPFCPHKMTNYWENDPVLKYEDFLRIDREWLRFCDAILLLDNWQESQGAKEEFRMAEQMGLQVFR